MVFDPLTGLWCVKDENDSSQVIEAIMPIRESLGCAAGILSHHPRKGDGTEATASRGSGALTGWVDTILELRRFDPADKTSRRRVLTAYGRDTDVQGEMVVELTGSGYVACGSRRPTRR